jgi:hypothetical protein
MATTNNTAARPQNVEKMQFKSVRGTPIGGHFEFLNLDTSVDEFLEAVRVEPVEA